MRTLEASTRRYAGDCRQAAGTITADPSASDPSESGCGATTSAGSVAVSPKSARSGMRFASAIVSWAITGGCPGARIASSRVVPWKAGATRTMSPSSSGCPAGRVGVNRPSRTSEAASPSAANAARSAVSVVAPSCSRYRPGVSTAPHTATSTPGSASIGRQISVIASMAAFGIRAGRFSEGSTGARRRLKADFAGCRGSSGAAAGRELGRERSPVVWVGLGHAQRPRSARCLPVSRSR